MVRHLQSHPYLGTGNHLQLLFSREYMYLLKRNLKVVSNSILATGNVSPKLFYWLAKIECHLTDTSLYPQNTPLLFSLGQGQPRSFPITLPEGLRHRLRWTKTSSGESDQRNSSTGCPTDLRASQKQASSLQSALSFCLEPPKFWCSSSQQPFCTALGNENS